MHERLVFSRHAAAVRGGDVIRSYPDDQPFPSYLTRGWIGIRPLHAVWSVDETEQATVIITVYEPDPARWESDFRSEKP